MAGTVVVVANIYPTEEARAEIIDILHRTQLAVHREEAGCELYALHENPGQLVMIEKWTAQANLEDHFRGRAFAELGPQLDGKLAKDIEILQFTPLPVGDTGQGAL
jgi:quinol monooxygenase YgiN